MAHCYNCGKDIQPGESSISLDDLNHSHDDCLRNPPQSDYEDQDEE